MNKRKKGRRFGWRTVLFCLFAAVFLVSAGITAKTLIEHRKADNAIRDLRVQTRQNLSDSGTAVKSQSGTAQQPEGTVPAEPEKAPDGQTPEGTAPDEKTSDGETPDEKTPERQISMDFTELLKINPDIKGWIFGEGTNVDYPVLQTDNNEFYLEHLYNKEANGSGSIFADCRNSGDFTDRNTVLYGHHMKNGTMFGSIEHYTSQDFYDAVPTMVLYTPEGDYLIELISGTHENGNVQFVELEFKTEEDFLKYVESLRERSTFKSDVEVRPGDRLISMCTCAYVFSNARYMLVGRLVPIYVSENTADAEANG